MYYSKPYKILSLIFFLIFSSCSHKFTKLETDSPGNIVEQILDLKIISEDKTERLTVYTQIDRINKRALLNGVGRFDRHIFTLSVSNDRYNFKDLVNNKVESGRLDDFFIMPLNPELFFEKVDIDLPQPTVIECSHSGKKLKIRVLEQSK